MLRPTLLAAMAALLSTTAFSQNDASSKLRPITSPVKDAGTYHLATGTWTRAKSPSAHFGLDTIYNNTCLLGYYVALSSLETMVDSGRLPSTSSGNSATSVQGSLDIYFINGFRVAYCATNALVDLDIAHYECYSPCTDATALTPTSAISLANLPGGGGSASALGCWIVDIDLEGSSFEFSLQADCDQLWDQSSSTDNFGWSQTEMNPAGAPAGPLLAGDPFGILAAGPLGTGCAYGDGTCFIGQDIWTQGTGLGTDDVFETDIGGAYAGCWFFGGYFSGNPYASFCHAMYAWVEPPFPGCGTSYCVGDDSGATLCPCANPSTNGGGCATGNGNGMLLECSGNPSATPASDSMVFSCSNQIANQPGLFFQGNNAINSGSGVQFGDGLRCAGGSVIRLQVRFADGAGDSATTIGIGAKGGVVAGDVKRYQLWGRDPNTTPCGGQFNLSNAIEITWPA